jgi:hypothetical protein
MAVNVDTVYRTVLLIINKEQRGYLTPDEFNKTATQVQLEIFNEYFEDLNQQIRVPENDSEYANRNKNLQEKIAIFHADGNCQWNNLGGYFDVPASTGAPVSETITAINSATSYTLTTLTASQIASGLPTVSFNGVLQPDSTWTINGNILILSAFPADGTNILINVYPYNFYKLGTVIYKGEKEVQYVQPNELLELNLSPLTKPSLYWPVYTYKDLKIKVYPTAITGNNIISCTYIRKPLDPSWNFTIGTSGQYIYNPNSSVNFELHPTEQTNLITRILLYSGIIIKDPQVIQIAAQQAQAENINSKS